MDTGSVCVFRLSSISLVLSGWHRLMQMHMLELVARPLGAIRLQLVTGVLLHHAREMIECQPKSLELLNQRVDRGAT